MAGRYVPDRGDLVWLEFDPRAGHEQAGRRPALVLSPKVYNRKVGLAFFCPITQQVKGYPFEVVLPDSGHVQGAILTDQVKSLDWRARQARRIDAIRADLLEEVQLKIHTLLFGN